MDPDLLELIKLLHAQLDAIAEMVKEDTDQNKRLMQRQRYLRLNHNIEALLSKLNRQHPN